MKTTMPHIRHPRQRLSLLNTTLLIAACITSIATSMATDVPGEATANSSLLEEGAVTVIVTLEPGAERRSLLGLEEVPLSLAMRLGEVDTAHAVRFRLSMLGAPTDDFVIEGELPESAAPSGVIGRLCGETTPATADCIPCPEDDLCVLSLTYQRCGHAAAFSTVAVSLESPGSGGEPVSAAGLGPSEEALIGSWVQITNVDVEAEPLCSDSGMTSIPTDGGME